MIKIKIQTERCIIREFHAEDIDCFIAYRNNLDWMRYQGFKGMPKTFYERVLLQQASLENGSQFAIIDTANGTLVGDIYLRKENDIYWIGYTVHPVYARKGYATEAVAATVKWVANQGGSAVKAGVLPENIASTNLLEKLNFTYSAKEDGEWIYIYNLK